MNKQQALTQILTFGSDRNRAFSILLNAENDPTLAPYFVTKTDLITVLEKYLAKQIDEDDIEQWANLIDFRPDIDGSEIEDYLYALANPTMMGNGDNKANILRMLAILTQA